MFLSKPVNVNRGNILRTQKAKRKEEEIDNNSYGGGGLAFTNLRHNRTCNTSLNYLVVLAYD